MNLYFRISRRNIDALVSGSKELWREEEKGGFSLTSTLYKDINKVRGGRFHYTKESY